MFIYLLPHAVPISMGGSVHYVVHDLKRINGQILVVHEDMSLKNTFRNDNHKTPKFNHFLIIFTQIYCKSYTQRAQI